MSGTTGGPEYDRCTPRGCFGTHDIGFALGLEAALDLCAEEEQVVPWGVWYLDDGTIAGTLEGVCSYFHKLVPALSQLGLQVNLHKCTLWGPGVHREGDMNDSLPDDLPLNHPIRSVPVVPYGPSKGITVLGVPCDAVGGTTHTANTWK